VLKARDRFSQEPISVLGGLSRSGVVQGQSRSGILECLSRSGKRREVVEIPGGRRVVKTEYLIEAERRVVEMKLAVCGEVAGCLLVARVVEVELGEVSNSLAGLVDAEVTVATETVVHIARNTRETLIGETGINRCSRTSVEAALRHISRNLDVKALEVGQVVVLGEPERAAKSFVTARGWTASRIGHRCDAELR